MFTRFTDEWLIDAALYTHFKGVPCCSPASVTPEEVSETVASCVGLCSDVPTFEMCKEVLVAPWPEDIKDELWRDRVLFRRVLFRTRAQLCQASTHTRATLVSRLRELAETSSVSSLLIDDDRLSTLKARLSKHFPSFYGAVLTHMLTQLSSFSLTGLDADGVHDAELLWEDALELGGTGKAKKKKKKKVGVKKMVVVKKKQGQQGQQGLQGQEETKES